MREKTIKLYKFSELPETIKEKVLEEFCDINVNFEWWLIEFDEAQSIGLELIEFDIRKNFCKGCWITNGKDCAKKILKTYDKHCKIYQDAERFLSDLEGARDDFEGREEYIPDLDNFEDSNSYDDICGAFLEILLDYYRNILQKVYEHLTSEKSIIETIEASEYEFRVNGEDLYLEK